MKWLFVVISFSIVSCSSSSEQAKQAVVLDTAIPTAVSTETATSSEYSTEEEVSAPGDETTSGIDSAWLSRFTGDPLGITSYDGLKGYLSGQGLESKDSTINGDQGVLFGKHSCIVILMTESYGDLVCSAEIDTSAFELNSNVVVGMSFAEFTQLSGVTSDDMVAISDDLRFFTYDMSYNEESGAHVQFYFKNEVLRNISWNVYPCIIYD